MRLTIEKEMCFVRWDRGETLGTNLTKFLLGCQGKKNFTKDGQGYYFHTAMANVELWLELWPETQVIDNREKEQVNKLDNSFFAFKLAPRPEFSIVHPQYEFQKRGFEHVKDLKISALYMGTGTGKTKMSIDKAVYLWCKHEIDSMLVFTKKGVHEQWIDEQLPEHVPDNIPYVAHAWQGMTTVWERKAFDAMIAKTNVLRVFSINIDAVDTKRGFEVICEFIKRCGGRMYGLVDESQDISDPDSNRHQNLMRIKDLMLYRSILSGTPISVSLENVWGQFQFLDEDIIGHAFKSAFRGEYCIMGGFQGKQITGHKKIERFYTKIAPVTFRATKEEDLDLPDKVYKSHYFKMTPKQASIYEKLRKEFLVELDNGAVTTVEHAATMVMRLQQIACGFIVDENQNVVKLDNPRLQTLIDLEQEIGVKEKKIIWVRFQEDARTLMAHFGSRAVDYMGFTSDKDRARNKALFLDKNSGKDIFISNPAAGGTGLNLQGECAYAIYYSNSYNAVHRWQSEDRIHRIGTYKTTYFIDLVASRTVDVRILANLKKKKDFSDFVLEDVRKLVEEGMRIAA